MAADYEKRMAAEAAIDLVTDGMVLGMGTGSTVDLAIALLGERVRGGLRIVCVPTSQGTRGLLERNGIPVRPLSDLSESFRPDLCVDGADEIDPALNLIKGRGGALLREKIVADASRRFVVIADESKLVKHLGEKALLPVEVLPDAVGHVRARLLEMLPEVTLRPARSENGNAILDCRLVPPIEDPDALETRINNIPGVFENGLFLSRAHLALVGTPRGVLTMERVPMNEE